MALGFRGGISVRDSGTVAPGTAAFILAFIKAFIGVFTFPGPTTADIQN